MITYNIKWFLGLSVAAHAAVLVAWNSPVVSPGNTGHTVQLSVIQRSGDSQEPPLLLTESTVQPEVENTTPLKQANNPADLLVADLETSRTHAQRPAHETQPDQTRSTALPLKTAATTAAVASNPVILQEETDRHLRSSVMELLTRKLTYPAIARHRGWQGVVKLELHIEADGSITGLQVDETSGYAILDEAAMQCLALASLPGAAQWLQGHAIDIVVPVEYRLLDG